jgi:hypothetical protein
MKVSKLRIVKAVQFISGSTGVEEFSTWHTKFESTQYPLGHSLMHV